VEEKQIITALGDAGAVAMPVSPANLPLPPGPALHDVAALGSSTSDDAHGFPAVIIDRATNRQVARPMMRLLRQAGIQVIDAGLASARNRQEVATAWANAGLPRPTTLVAFSEASGVQAANMVGYPATLLPMIPGTTPTTLLDEDTADAVIEHRIVLGSADEAVVLLQAGAPTGDHLVRVHIVGGEAIAFDGDSAPIEALKLARKAAVAVDADVVAIDIATINGSMVVWDAIPVADFRRSTLLGEKTVGEAIASLAYTRATISAPVTESEVEDVLALSA
jgi:hypothetical protein